MSRYTGAKLKLARKVGEDLGLKSNAAKTAKRIGVRPGQHGAKMRKKLSDFGVQLREKQRVKFTYGITEKQLERLFAEASKNPTATGDALLGLLERRLDNVIFRLGWTLTRAAARQLVAHSHVRVNDKKMNIASYRCNVTDVITLTNKGASIPSISEAIKADAAQVPVWLTAKQGTAQIKQLPERADITESLTMQLVVEYYSR